VLLSKQFLFFLNPETDHGTPISRSLLLVWELPLHSISPGTDRYSVTALSLLFVPFILHHCHLITVCPLCLVYHWHPWMLSTLKAKTQL